MKSIMNIPGLKDVLITKIEEIEEGVALFIEMSKNAYSCAVWQSLTSEIHDDLAI